MISCRSRDPGCSDSVGARSDMLASRLGNLSAILSQPGSTPNTYPISEQFPYSFIITPMITIPQIVGGEKTSVMKKTPRSAAELSQTVS